MKHKILFSGALLAAAISFGACTITTERLSDVTNQAGSAETSAQPAVSSASAAPEETPETTPAATPTATPEETPEPTADPSAEDAFAKAAAEAEELVLEGEYQKAITMLSDLEEEHPEAKDRRLQAEYLFASANLKRTNTTTYGYLTELVKEKYPGAKYLYDQLYKWNYKIYVNQSEEDTSTDFDDFLREDPICVHIKAEGGPPNGTTSVSAQAYFLHGGEFGTYSADLKSGEELLITGQYQGDDEDKTDALFIDLFNANGKLIDEDFAWIN